jgi:hypothetical protein
MLATLIIRDWKEVLKNFQVAHLWYYSMKRPKSGNLKKQKKKCFFFFYKL